jgi:flagellar hook-basal body complex protein FliE
MEISALTNVSGLSQAFPTRPEAAGSQQNPTVGFGKVMEEMIGKVSDLQNKADQSIQSVATGQSTGLHEVMIAVEKASVSFQMLTQVRNKAVEAYQEIMRMPV